MMGGIGCFISSAITLLVSYHFVIFSDETGGSFCSTSFFPRFSSLVLLPENLVTKPKPSLHNSLEKFQSQPRYQITTAQMFPEARPLQCGWGRFAILQEPHKITQYTSRNPRLGIPDIPPRAPHRGTSPMRRALPWPRPRCLLI
jgi:hypothetical protein